MSDIKVSGLRHVYSAGTPFEKVAIDDINIEIPHGQFVGLIGHTGSGKSTFIQHLNALLKPTSGTVTVDGENINADKISAKNVRYKVGLVFQYPEYQLFEETVYADIAFGPKNMGLSATEIDERVREAAHFVGVRTSSLKNLRSSFPAVRSAGSQLPALLPCARAFSSSTSRRRDLIPQAASKFCATSVTIARRQAQQSSS